MWPAFEGDLKQDRRSARERPGVRAASAAAFARFVAPGIGDFSRPRARPARVGPRMARINADGTGLLRQDRKPSPTSPSSTPSPCSAPTTPTTPHSTNLPTTAHHPAPQRIPACTGLTPLPLRETPGFIERFDEAWLSINSRGGAWLR